MTNRYASATWITVLLLATATFASLGTASDASLDVIRHEDSRESAMTAPPWPAPVKAVGTAAESGAAMHSATHSLDSRKGLSNSSVTSNVQYGTSNVQHGTTAEASYGPVRQRWDEKRFDRGARAAASGDLIISQYVETNSGITPKGIELWNATGATIDFGTDELVVETICKRRSGFFPDHRVHAGHRHARGR